MGDCWELELPALPPHPVGTLLALLCLVLTACQRHVLIPSPTRVAFAPTIGVCTGETSMAQRLIRSVSRRNFIKGAGALSASLTTALFVPGRASAQQKTLKILQWNHFVPGYDKWFNEIYVKAWGEKNTTNVMVDNIGLAGLNRRDVEEVCVQKGYDLFMFLW